MSGNINFGIFLGIPKSYFNDIDYSNALQHFLSDAKKAGTHAQATANVADTDATYCRKQIDTQETLVIDFFGNQIYNPPSSG